MIHDVILSLLSEKESSVIKELLVSRGNRRNPPNFVKSNLFLQTLEISSNFIHPAEMKTLKDINKISNQYRDIRKFIALYNSCANENAQLTLGVEGNSLSTGFYLQAFANGLEQAIECYQNTVVDLEKKFLRKPTLSLMFIYVEVEKFRPLFEFLSRMISSVKTQRLFGCQILQYLQDNVLHGDKSIMKAVQM
jgi:gamma-tubulin complex component 4